MDDDFTATWPDETPRHYTNWIILRRNDLDLALDLGFVRDRNDEGEFEPKEVAQVVMSWEQALILHTLLGREIATYEAEVGPIRRAAALPPMVDPESNGGTEPDA